MNTIVGTAKAKYIRVAPRKMRAVGDLVKGLTVNEAEAQLLMNPRRAAKPLLKALRSAVANFKLRSAGAKAEDLIVMNVTVDKGPMIKRFLPRARGSASPIHKVMSHITVTLSENAKTSKARFSIVVKKKAKTTGDESVKRAPKKKTDHETGVAKSEKQAGGLKRVFRRKTEGGE